MPTSKHRRKNRNRKSPRVARPSIRRLGDKADGLQRFKLAYAQGLQAAGKLGEAQVLAAQADDEQESEDKIRLADQALAISPDCTEAYIVLAEERGESMEDTAELYRKGVEAAERVLATTPPGPEGNVFLDVLRSAIYPRAQAGLAFTLWELGQHEASVGIHRNIVETAAEDILGAANTLFAHLVVLARDPEAEALYERFGKELDATWCYSRALLDFRRLGDSPAASRSLQRAIAKNPAVRAFLIQGEATWYVPEIDADLEVLEAWSYATDLKEAWLATSGALGWLKAQGEMR